MTNNSSPNQLAKTQTNWLEKNSYYNYTILSTKKGIILGTVFACTNFKISSLLCKLILGIYKARSVSDRYKITLKFLRASRCLYGAYSKFRNGNSKAEFRKEIQEGKFKSGIQKREFWLTNLIQNKNLYICIFLFLFS